MWIFITFKTAGGLAAPWSVGKIFLDSIISRLMKSKAPSQGFCSSWTNWHLPPLTCKLCCLTSCLLHTWTPSQPLFTHKLLHINRFDWNFLCVERGGGDRERSHQVMLYYFIDSKFFFLLYKAGVAILWSFGTHRSPYTKWAPILPSDNLIPCFCCSGTSLYWPSLICKRQSCCLEKD